MLLIVGVKGGVGATTVAVEVARAVDAVAFDLADGQLAARFDRPAWLLSAIAFAPALVRRERIDEAVRRRVALLWSPECALTPDKVWSVVRDIGNRCPVVADGGIEPPLGVEQLIEEAIIVSADNDIARWHERRLKIRYPHARVTPGSREAARALGDQLFRIT